MPNLEVVISLLCHIKVSVDFGAAVADVSRFGDSCELRNLEEKKDTQLV